MLLEKIKAVQLSAKRPCILVIGDLMIDHYITGEASRLSPEAPVPVVNAKSDKFTLGGSGNVIKNLTALGARVVAAGITGNDECAQRIMTMLKQNDISTDAIIMDSSRATTLKTRVLVGSHQMIRIDREITEQLSAEKENELLIQLTCLMPQADIIVLSDYNKGLFSLSITQSIISLATALGKKVLIDPKGLYYSKYKGAYLIKPNRKELAEAARMEKITSSDELKQAAQIILEQTGSKYLVVTLSEEGIAIISDDYYKHLPVKVSEVFDVTGAGDTAMAVMSYFIALGFTIEEACEAANNAAAIVIRQVGSATTNLDELINYMSGN